MYRVCAGYKYTLRRSPYVYARSNNANRCCTWSVKSFWKTFCSIDIGRSQWLVFLVLFLTSCCFATCLGVRHLAYIRVRRRRCHGNTKHLFYVPRPRSEKQQLYELDPAIHQCNHACSNGYTAAKLLD